MKCKPTTVQTPANLIFESVARPLGRCCPPHTLLGRKDPSDFRRSPPWSFPQMHSALRTGSHLSVSSLASEGHRTSSRICPDHSWNITPDQPVLLQGQKSLNAADLPRWQQTCPKSRQITSTFGRYSSVCRPPPVKPFASDAMRLICRKQSGCRHLASHSAWLASRPDVAAPVQATAPSA